MRVIVGTTNGVVKTLDLESKATLALWGEQKADTNVECLGWALPNSEKEVIAGYEHGVIKVWDTTNGKAIVELANYDGKIRGAFCYPKITGRVIVACTQSRKLTVRSVTIKSEENEEAQPLASCEVERGNKAQVMRMRHCPHNKERVGVVGKQVEPQVWNFETMKCIWKAKQVSLNFLRQPRPVENMDFQFLVNNRNCLVTGTRQRLMRVYDTQQKDKRPVLEVEVPHFEYSIISVGVTSHQPNSVFLTEGSGRMSKLDLRNGRLETVYRGAPGAVRGLAYHPTKPLMATACLDRFVRVYDLKKPKIENSRLTEFNMPYKVYGKQRLSSVLFSEDESIQEKKEQHKKHKIDTLWESLENLPSAKLGLDDDTLLTQRVILSTMDGTHINPLGHSDEEFSKESDISDNEGDYEEENSDKNESENDESENDKKNGDNGSENELCKNESDNNNSDDNKASDKELVESKKNSMKTSFDNNRKNSENSSVHLKNDVNIFLNGKRKRKN